MSWETIVVLAVGFINLLLGWFLRILWGSIQNLQKEIGEVEDEIANHARYATETYVRRDDYRNELSELKSELGELKNLMNQVLTKLGEKQDK